MPQSDRPITKPVSGTRPTGVSLIRCSSERHSRPTPPLSIHVSIEPLRRHCDLSPITIERLVALLESYAQQTGTTVDLLVVGALALQAYGYVDRVTHDVDGEVTGDLDRLVHFLREHQIPADLGENISGWSVVAMPPGYRSRASVFLERPGVRLRTLDPTDFIIAKLRRGTDLDFQDADYVVEHFAVSSKTIQKAALAAIDASPKDTALFTLSKNSGRVLFPFGSKPNG